MALCEAQPKELGPHMARTCVDICAESIGLFPGDCLVCFCLAFVFLALLLEEFTFTDVSPESEKENLDCDLFFLVSEKSWEQNRSLLPC